MAQAISLLKESHENFWLPEGYYLALQFAQGWLVVMIRGAEGSNMRPFSLGGVSADGNLSDWNEIKDASDRKYLMPHKEALLKQIFWGVSPAKAKVFFQYASRQDRWSLIAVTRTLTGDIGYVDGEMSPFNGPFSKKTQFFSVYQLYPAFNIHNPTNDRMLDVKLNFDVMTYTYKIVTDKKLIEQLLSGERRVTKHTVGGIDPQPATCPDWLVKLNKAPDGSDLFAYTKELGY